MCKRHKTGDFSPQKWKEKIILLNADTSMSYPLDKHDSIALHIILHCDGLLDEWTVL